MVHRQWTCGKLVWPLEGFALQIVNGQQLDEVQKVNGSITFIKVLILADWHWTVICVD